MPTDPAQPSDVGAGDASPSEAAPRVASEETAPSAAPSPNGAPAAGSAGALPDPEPPVDPEPPTDPESPAEAEAEAEDELALLCDKAAKADEYLALAQRTKADFENYRRRSMRDAAGAQERGIAKLAKELLAAVDNLDRALTAAQAQPQAEAASPDDGSQLLSGIRLVHADVLSAFARYGIEPYSPVGEPFDPALHEAVAQQPFEGHEPGTVVEVYQLGYRLGDGVLRPARVMVAA